MQQFTAASPDTPVRAFTRIAFSPSVQAAQARHGAREHAARMAQREPAHDRLNDDLIGFIGGADSCFIATASADGWPHVQHRGGPPGFLKVLDDHTLAFANYRGNRQYITVGNLAENDRVLLFLIDYERGRRLKVWGHATEICDDAALLQRVRDPDYPAVVEGAIRIEVKAWDLNCRQHFPKLAQADR